MNPYLLIHYVATASCFVLGFSAFAANKRRVPSHAFLAVSLFVGTWMTCLAVSFSSTNEQLVALAIRGSNSIGLFIPLSFNWLRLSIKNKPKRLLDVVKQPKLWTVSAILFFALCFTDFFLEGVFIPVSAQTGLTGIPEPRYGAGFVLYAAYLVFTIALLIWRLVYDTPKAVGVQKAELQYIEVGGIVGLILAVTFTVIIPIASGQSQTAQLSGIAAAIFQGIVAYGIATRSIMEVSQFIRVTVTYALLALMLIALYLGSFFPARFIFNHLLPEITVLPYVLSSLVVAFSMAPAHGYLQRLAARLFTNLNPTDVSWVMDKSNDLLQSLGTVETVLKQGAGIVSRSMEIEDVRIYLADGDGFALKYELSVTETRPPSLIPTDDPIVTAIGLQNRPLITDVIPRMAPLPSLTKAHRRLKNMNTASATAIRSKSGIQGLLLTGKRVGEKLFGPPEQNALRTVADHLGAAIENAKLYTQLQESKVFNDILVDNLVSGVIAVNSSRSVIVFNREAQRITALNPAQVIEQPVESLPSPLREAVDETFYCGSGFRDKEMELKTANDESIPIRLGSAVFRSTDGKLTGILLVFSDLTTVKRLEMQVRRSAHLASLGTLSAGMAHEIKNPLVALKTFSELLPERYTDPEFRSTFSDLVGKEVARIDSIINQLLRFGRPAKAELRPIHVNEVLNQSLRLSQAKLRQKKITLHADFGDDTQDLIEGDANQLQQAFVNFILNAIDAMEPDGELTVGVNLTTVRTDRPDEESKPYILVTISDTGKGITEDDLPRIFDPFFTTKQSGSGMGLSVAHGFIQDHQGTIDVESEQGKGTCFRISLPLLEQEPSSQRAS